MNKFGMIELFETYKEVKKTLIDMLLFSLFEDIVLIDDVTLEHFLNKNNIHLNQSELNDLVNKTTELIEQNFMNDYKKELESNFEQSMIILLNDSSLTDIMNKNKNSKNDLINNLVGSVDEYIKSGSWFDTEKGYFVLQNKMLNFCIEKYVKTNI